MEWIVLNDWRGRMGGQQVSLSTAEVIDDRLFSLAELRANGVILEPFDAARHAQALAVYRGAYRSGGDLGAFLQALGLAGSTATATVAPTDLYVSNLNGDDRADGADPAHPVATLATAEAAIAHVLRQGDPVQVHVGRHAGIGYTWPSFGPRLLQAALYLNFDGAGQAGEDGFAELVASTVATGGSDDTIVVAGGLGVNTWRGKTVEILTGDAASDRRTIQEHTDTTITVSRDFTVDIVATDTFRIVEPEIQIDLDSFGTTVPLLDGFQGGAGPVLTVINTRFVGTGSKFPSVIGSEVRLFGVELQAAANLTSRDGARVSCGLMGPPLATSVETDLDLGATEWEGWGISKPLNQDFFVAFQVRDQSVLLGYFFGAGLIVSQGGFAFVFGGNLFGNPVGFVSGMSVNLGEARINTGRFEGQGSNPAVFVDVNARLQVLRATVVASSGAALRVSGGSTFRELVSGGVVGSSATGFGVDASRGGRVYFAGLPAVTGLAGADLTADAVASFAVATLAASGDRVADTGVGATPTAVSDGSIIQRV